ncbi:PLP-dependent aminotransferase family protein [Modestobacter roseus]|uniref:DNA-binding transcriptional MocR family regulator n=1 Tax=Modestobacter roseus TaxID=1181884 RepID=A0A562IX19_9ACTN|nr:PLP-dependent aminotransferase family protein [Modestobacter roseus]MQA33980.1 aminotransferase class I/II-fold pyridoxal phosphate-dependent enzyme [Modestobacter roseus]TWH75528.1 DNA-binding transcriptional MocR family regulator [Modestobacter roseus]
MPPAVVEQSTPAQELATLIGAVTALPAPRYAGLARRIRELVDAGRLPAGSRLPAERDLATALATSRVTVASAYRVLREEGWARTRHGSGTVLEPPGGAPARDWLPTDAPGHIDLAHAAPAATSQLEPAYRTALERLPALTTGHGYAPGGLPELRAAIADRFTARGLPTDPDQVVVTAGVGDAAAVVAEAVLEPGDRVLVEHPSYPGALRVVEGAGARLVPVAVDPAHPDALVEAAHLAVRQSGPRLAYLMPDFTNPTGARMSAAGRRRLAATLWQQGVVTVVDEVCAELYLDDGPLPPYAAGLPDAATVTIGGLAKAVWGGLRIGWLRTDAALAARLATVFGRRQLSVGLLDQLAATVLVRDLDAVLAERRAQLIAQRAALLTALADRLPEWRVHPPAGGLSVWCALPPGLSSAALAAAAAPRGVLLAEGRVFGTGHAFDDHLRLPFTRPAEDLRTAVDVLAGLAAELRSDLGRTPAPRTVV